MEYENYKSAGQRKRSVIKLSGRQRFVWKNFLDIPQKKTQVRNPQRPKYNTNPDRLDNNICRKRCNKFVKNQGMSKEIEDVLENKFNVRDFDGLSS
mmetsp:Transcript_60913/g.69663  ORF Transcript_60913/g.69663 Transcript_60913/m.69663 type:complete len:96 (-) Transcript_60913:274-561(-)